MVHSIVKRNPSHKPDSNRQKIRTKRCGRATYLADDDQIALDSVADTAHRAVHVVILQVLGDGRTVRDDPKLELTRNRARFPLTIYTICVVARKPLTCESKEKGREEEGKGSVLQYCRRASRFRLHYFLLMTVIELSPLRVRVRRPCRRRMER
jgi:hypothetical protein